MNRPTPGRLKEPIMMAQVGGTWWIIPAAIDGIEVNSQRAVEHARLTGRRISAHLDLLSAAAELRRLRG
jgi:hypothetical protein